METHRELQKTVTATMMEWTLTMIPSLPKVKRESSLEHLENIFLACTFDYDDLISIFYICFVQVARGKQKAKLLIQWTTELSSQTCSFCFSSIWKSIPDSYLCYLYLDSDSVVNRHYLFSMFYHYNYMLITN